MSTNFTRVHARKIVQKFRNAAPVNAPKRTLFNVDFVHFLVAKINTFNISVVRDFLAQDSNGTSTAISAATSPLGGKQVDFLTGYNDYRTSRPAACGLGEI